MRVRHGLHLHARSAFSLVCLTHTTNPHVKVRDVGDGDLKKRNHSRATPHHPPPSPTHTQQITLTPPTTTLITYLVLGPLVCSSIEQQSDR